LRRTQQTTCMATTTNSGRRKSKGNEDRQQSHRNSNAELKSISGRTTLASFHSNATSTHPHSCTKAMTTLSDGHLGKQEADNLHSNAELHSVYSNGESVRLYSNLMSANYHGNATSMRYRRNATSATWRTTQPHPKTSGFEGEICRDTSHPAVIGGGGDSTWPAAVWGPGQAWE
jgi:hypothetical protein